MNIGIYSLEGDGTFTVQNFREHGHDVAMYISREADRKIQDGLVWKLDDFNELSQADIIIFDHNGKGNVADLFRERGKTVWCGGSIMDRLEKDRSFGMKTFAEYGIPIPDTWEVSGLGDVKTVLSSEFQRGEKCVVKLDDSSLSSVSFVADNPKQLLEQVEHWEEDQAIKTPWTGIIQRCVDGVEVSVEGWWGVDGWSNVNLTIEEKKPWPGDLGPNTGCSFNTVCMISPNSRLFKMMLEPMGAFMKKHGYMGQIDTNSIVGPDGPQALEFTPRPGYDATPTLVWGQSIGYGDLVSSALGGVKKDGSAPQGSLDGHGHPGPFWAGVRVTVPPYPFDSKDDDLTNKANETACGVPVVVPPAAQRDFYLHDVCASQRGLVCAGTSGVIGLALGGGSSPKEAGKAAYRVAEKLQIPNKAYRAIDGWHRAEKQIPELISEGWIKL